VFGAPSSYRLRLRHDEILDARRDLIAAGQKLDDGGANLDYETKSPP
jgi:hypothetical protein